jgi:hypothetical protein
MELWIPDSILGCIQFLYDFGWNSRDKMLTETFIFQLHESQPHSKKLDSGRIFVSESQLWEAKQYPCSPKTVPPRSCRDHHSTQGTRLNMFSSFSDIKQADGQQLNLCSMQQSDYFKGFVRIGRTSTHDTNFRLVSCLRRISALLPMSTSVSEKCFHIMEQRCFAIMCSPSACDTKI